MIILFRKSTQYLYTTNNTVRIEKYFKEDNFTRESLIELHKQSNNIIGDLCCSVIDTERSVEISSENLIKIFAGIVFLWKLFIFPYCGEKSSAAFSLSTELELFAELICKNNLLELQRRNSLPVPWEMLLLAHTPLHSINCICIHFTSSGIRLLLSTT